MPPTTTAVGHIEPCSVAHHVRIIPLGVSTGIESGADRFLEGLSASTNAPPEPAVQRV